MHLPPPQEDALRVALERRVREVLDHPERLPTDGLPTAVLVSLCRARESFAIVDQARELGAAARELVALASRAQAREENRTASALFTYEALRYAVSPSAAARLAGRAAREAGLDADANPHADPPDHVLGVAWLMGWNETALRGAP